MNENKTLCVKGGNHSPLKKSVNVGTLHDQFNQRQTLSFQIVL